MTNPIDRPLPSCDPPLLRVTLGEMLRRVRHTQRRTLADVAEAARVSLPYLSEIERGHKEVSSEVLAAICAALGIQVHELLIVVGRRMAVSSVQRASAAPVAVRSPQALALAA